MGPWIRVFLVVSTAVEERERKEKQASQPLGKKGAFYRSPTKSDRYRDFTLENLAPRGEISAALTGSRAQKSLVEIRGPDYSNNPPPSQPGLSGLEENINTKPTTTFAFRLCF
jgi:hypothetical protein